MTAKDKAIIANFPGKTPYELHAEYDLSKKGFDELIFRSDAETDALLSSKEVRGHLRQMPVVTPLISTYQGPGATVTVHNTLTGRNQELAPKMADIMVRKYPKEYTIIG